MISAFALSDLLYCESRKTQLLSLWVDRDLKYLNNPPGGDSSRDGGKEKKTTPPGISISPRRAP